MTTIQIEATPMQLKQINAFVEKIGAKIVKSEPKEAVVQKQELHPNLIETDDYCKYLKNEIIKEYNKTAKIKAEQIL